MFLLKNKSVITILVATVVLLSAPLSFAVDAYAAETKTTVTEKKTDSNTKADKQKVREQKLKKLSKTSYKYWLKYKKAVKSTKVRKAISKRMKRETGNTIDKNGFPRNWKSKYLFGASLRGRYWGPYCMTKSLYNHIKISKIKKISKTDKKLAYMCIAAEAQEYMEGRYSKWTNVNRKGWW
jgi:hypothetical protein